MKFTDEEVIKAFGCHTKRNCGDCPMCGKGCADKLIEVALDLINRQRVESLTEYVIELEKRLIAGGLGIAYVRSQMYKLLKEMTEGNDE